MQGLSVNETRMVNYLVRHVNERNSINALAKAIAMSPNGTYKVLKKLEAAGIIIPEKFANAVMYRMNYANEQARKLAEYVLLERTLNAYAKLREEDLQQTKGPVLAAVLFGSVLHKGKEARDVDVLIVLEKSNFDEAAALLDKAQFRMPKKLHRVYQTPEDLVENLRKKDEVVEDILKTGAVLFGAEALVDVLKEISSQPHPV